MGSKQTTGSRTLPSLSAVCTACGMRRGSNKGAAAMKTDAGGVTLVAAVTAPKPTQFVVASALPVWVTKYNFVEEGYRHPEQHSTFAACLSSVFFSVSNETLNVQSHLWAGVGALVCLVWAVQQPSFFVASTEGQLAIVLSCMTTFIMGVSSAVAHTFNVMSDEMRGHMWRVDYIGILCPLFARQWNDSWYIALALGGDSASTVFFALQALAVFIALYCAYHIMYERYTVVNISFLWSNLPLMITMQFLARNAPVPFVRAATYAFCSSLSIAIGGIAYNTFVPERYFPSSPIFSYFGNSHHWLHVFSSAACYFNTFGTLEISAYEAARRIAVVQGD